MVKQEQSGEGIGKGLMVVAVLAVVVSVFGMVMTYNTLSEMNSWMTGFAAYNTSATVNVSINSITAINFSTGNITFGVGVVSPGSARANLSTTGINTGGSGFSTVNQGFVLSNIGNSNVTVRLWADKNATILFGDSSTDPVFTYNVSNNVTGSCAREGDVTLGLYNNINITAPGTIICNDFLYNVNKQSLRIDLFFSIPFDANTTGVDLKTTFMAEATSL